MEGDVMPAPRANPEQGVPGSHSVADVADVLSGWAFGGGVVTLALFPLALPILALTAVAVLPLVVPVLAVGLVVAAVALPVLAARSVGRRVRAVERPTPARPGA
jgi:hypothetical protein